MNVKVNRLGNVDVEEVKAIMNDVMEEARAVEPTPAPIISAEDMQKVMSVLYGKVDFNTFKTIERILGGEQ